VVTAVATAAFVILLFTNEPQRPAAIPDAGPDTGLSCGGTPNPSIKKPWWANGRGSMPSFAGSLAPEQITAVVAYTRTNLG
jgi:hypothetical protein